MPHAAIRGRKFLSPAPSPASELNPVLLRILAGDYGGGLALYRKLAHPGAEDRRWAAMCLMHASQWVDAKVLLLDAVAQGYQEASIELATLYRTLGEVGLAQATIGALPLEALRKSDQALAYRELGLQAYQQGDLGQAATRLQQAWAAAAASRLGTPLITPIAHALGIVCAERGLDDQADSYFDYAQLHAHPTRQVFVQASRAISAAYLGQLDRAVECLAQAPACPADAASPADLQVLYARGITARAARAYAEAADHLQLLSGRATAAGDIELACYAELWLASVALAQGQFGAAQRHVARAEQLSAAPKTEAMVLLRRGLLAARRGQDGTAALETAARLFSGPGRRREEGWCWLCLCEAHLALGDDVRAEAALAQALQIRYAVNTSSLAIELDSLPLVRQHLERRGADDARCLLQDERRFSRGGQTQIRLQTMGAARILVNGQTLGLNMARTPELLTYFLTHRKFTLPQLQVALFADHPHKRSKSYIHQVRAELQRLVPGLTIPFDPATRTYTLHLEEHLSLTWDVDVLLGALKTEDPAVILEHIALYEGPFLAEATAEWAEFTRTELQQLVLSRCRAQLDRWKAAGQWGPVLSLCEALQRVEFDEVLCADLVTALEHVHGPEMASARLSALAKRWTAEFGEPSPVLTALLSELTPA